MSPSRLFAALLLWLCAFVSVAEINPEWVRYPAISPDGSAVAFTFKGDLYRVDVTGGEATRLTFHSAHDFKPVWSADGKKLAFASERHGNFDIFIMDARGGEATRLTFDSTDEVPYDITDAKNGQPERVIFKGVRMDTHSHRQYPSARFPEIYTVSTLGGHVSQLFTVAAEEINLSSNGRYLVYQDIKGYENAWRKHHKSSVTRDIWLYNTSTKEHEMLTRVEGEDRNPVFSDDDQHIYFLSERAGTFNVFKMPASNPEQVEQLTNFELHPVRFLSQANNTLAFSHHGILYTMKDGQRPRPLSISIRTQDTTNRETFADINGEIEEFSVSPNGKELAFIANGDVFVASKDGKFTKQITDTPEAEASVAFSPDGETLIYASERNLKWHIFTATKARPSEPFFYASSLINEKALFNNEKDIYLPKFSPDSQRIAFIEDRRTLKVAELDGSNAKTLVARSEMIHFRDGDQDFAWSPDSQYLLFTHSRLLNNADIAVVKADGSEPFRALSQSAYYDSNANWIMNGDAILWFSNKNGLRSYATSGRSQQDVYASFLDQKSWDRFRLSEEDFALLEAIEQANKPAQDSNKEEAEEGSKSGEDQTVQPINIQWEGLEERIARLTIHSSFIDDAVLDKKAENLYYVTRFEDELDLWKSDLRKKETKKLISLKADNGELAWDKQFETLYFLGDGKLYTIDFEDEKRKEIKIKADIRKTSPDLFNAAFDHVWLRTKKAFYDPTYHGVDWEKMYAEYRPKVAHIDNAHEFAELASELLGELNVSHAGARASSGFNMENKDDTARLGIFYDYQHTKNGITITEIVDGGPLDKAGLNVKPGDTITHIDAHAIDHTFDWARLLNQKVDKFVLLTIMDDTGDSKQISVKPISTRDQGRLLYKRFVDINEQHVLSSSNNQLGYVHIPSMSDGPYRNVFDTMLGKHYDKKAMVVDTRFNGGGDLVADLAAFFTGESFISYETADKIVGGEPTSRYTKPIVGLFNESMYSDGHCYASGFEDLDLGTSIGMPVPGTCSFAGWETLPIGVRWGMVPVSAKNKQGEWMENNQTHPDIRIKNLPSALSGGEDKQLDKAITTLLEQIQ